MINDRPPSYHPLTCSANFKIHSDSTPCTGRLQMWGLRFYNFQLWEMFFKFPSQVDKTSESKECPNIFCFSDFCFPNAFFPNKTAQRITPKIRRLHHEPTCWVKTAGFLLPKVCHGLRRRVFFQHFPNRRQCETDSGRCMADIFTSPQNTVDPCVTCQLME